MRKPPGGLGRLFWNFVVAGGSDTPRHNLNSPGNQALAKGDGLRPIGPGEADLAAEFDIAWRNRTDNHRAHLAEAGITFEAMLRAGDLGVERIAYAGRLYTPSPAGFPAVILAIWSPAPPSIYCAIEDPEILDLITFRTDDPGRWWHRIGEPDLILGEDRYLDATQTGAPLKVFESPVAWLRGGCGGCVILDDAEARWTTERFAEDQVALEDGWRATS